MMEHDLHSAWNSVFPSVPKQLLAVGSINIFMIPALTNINKEEKH